MERNVSRKRYILRLALALAVLAVCGVAAYGFSAKAKEPVNTEQFSDAAGVLRYIKNPSCYYLDMKEGGLLDMLYTSLQNLANALWGTLRLWGVITTVLFYFCMDFNLVDLFGGGIDSLQSALMGGIFEPLFSIGFLGAVIVVLKNMLRRDTMGILGQFGKVIGVWVLSMLLVSHTGTILKCATEVTKSISCQILVSMSGGSGNETESYATQMADVIWNATVHQPWVYIEFLGTEVDEETIDIFLNSPPHDSNRQRLVNEDERGAFDMRNMTEKIAFIIAYSIPFGIKCFIYIALSVITLSYQFFAVFYVLLAPVMLILMMFPGYERTINVWIRKLIETQVGILLLTMVLGILVRVDELLYSRMAFSWGWLVVLNVQSGLEIIVLIKRKDITAGLNRLQKSITNPVYAAKMVRDGSTGGFAAAAGTAIRTGAMIHVAGKVMKVAGGGAGQAIGAAASGVGKAAGGAAVSAASQVTAQAVTSAGKTELPEAVTASARPRMSDCLADARREPVKSHLERMDTGPEQGDRSQIARPSMDIGAVNAEITEKLQGRQAEMTLERPKTAPIHTNQVNIPLRGETRQERPSERPERHIMRAQGSPSASVSGQGSSLERPKLEVTRPEAARPEVTRSETLFQETTESGNIERKEKELCRQEKKEISGGTERNSVHEQVRATQRREAKHTAQTYISRENVADRIQKKHITQTAKVERPSSSVKRT